MTETDPVPLSRRARQREATYAEIVATSRTLLARGEEISLRAVAAQMGMTAPALYRYVASYQELVDLVAFEIDKAATDGFREAADRMPEDDAMARLIAASVAFRRWALANRSEFSLVFANPVADTQCVRRELITAWASGLYMHSLLIDVWTQTQYAHPALDELDPVVREVVADPLFPVDLSIVPDEHRGLLWVFMQGWATLYGTVTLECFGHMDPRVIESGSLFEAMLADWLPRLGVPASEEPRYRALLRAEIDLAD